MSRAEHAFELDRLSTVIPSQEFAALFLALKSIWRFWREKKESEDFQQRNLFKSLKYWFQLCNALFSE